MFHIKVHHLNIQPLSTKFDSLTTLLDTLQTSGIYSDYILLCKIFIHQGNKHPFNTPGYNLITKNRSSKTRGGVSIYEKEPTQYTLREELMILT